MPKIGRNWVCDGCGEDAGLHSTETGEHKYWCWKCYEDKRPSARGWVYEKGDKNDTKD